MVMVMVMADAAVSVRVVSVPEQRTREHPELDGGAELVQRARRGRGMRLAAHDECNGREKCQQQQPWLRRDCPVDELVLAGCVWGQKRELAFAFALRRVGRAGQHSMKYQGWRVG